MKNILLAALLVVGLGVSGALADVTRSFPAIKDAGITTLGEHTNRGGDSQISFCNGTVNSGEFGIFDFDRAAIQSYIISNLLSNGLTLQDGICMSRIQVNFSLVCSGNVDPNAQVGLMSVYTDDNWVEGAGSSGLGATAAYNWLGASTGISACTSAAPNDYVGQGYNWHRVDTNTYAQKLQDIAGTPNSTTMTNWAQNVRTSVDLDEALWCGYIFGKDAQDVTIAAPASTMLKTYGLASGGSPMTCYTREATGGYSPMLTVTLMVIDEQWPHPGDANNDNAVDVIDLGILAKYYDTATGASWAMGDFSGGGSVDVVDLGILAKNYDWKGYPPVPEPGSAMFLLLTGLALSRRLGRK